MTPYKWLMVRRTAYHKCMGLLLKDVFRLGKLQGPGLLLSNPKGQQVQVYPRVLSQTGDNPQLLEDCCIMGAFKARYRCENCLCPGDAMNDIVGTADGRWGVCF